MINKRETETKKITVEKGASSRKRIPLIIQAIENCKAGEKYNRYAICEQLADIMVNKYKGNNLDYQSKRMGMATSTDMLKAIDLYFYKYFKVC